MKTQGGDSGARPEALDVKRDERAFRKGLSTIQRRVKVRGLGAFSRRTAVGRALIAWREDLLRDCGGEEHLSTQRRALVDLVTRTRLLLDHCDAFLLAQPSLINKSKRMLLPIVRERMVLADSFARMLGQLGLDRVPKPAPNITASQLQRARQQILEMSKQEEVDEHDESTEADGTT